MPPQLNAERHNQLLAKYYIPDMGGNSAIGSDLSFILDRLDKDSALSPQDKQYIRDKGLFDLCEFVKNLEETGKPDFWIIRSKYEKQQKSKIRRELWLTYDIDYVESAHMRQMMDILLRVDKNSRLTDQDVLWLTEHRYFSQELKRVFHNNEALYFRQSFERDNNPWDAINASSHYRKANQPSEAVNFLDQLDIDTQKDKHLKSALCTTKGGAKRDLRKMDEALALAERAHDYDNRSFHPCTLLGAIHYEKGNLVIGNEWFVKAVERGATDSGIDHELRSIFRRAGKEQQEILKQHLLHMNPSRYDWVNTINTRKSKKLHSK